MFGFLKKQKKELVEEKESAEKVNINPMIFNRLNDTKKSDKYSYPIKPPEILKCVVPQGEFAPVLATDNACYNSSVDYAYGVTTQGFPGFPYLANLSTRAEYRAFSSCLSSEITRKWIKLTSSDTRGLAQEKIKKIEFEIERLKIKNVIQKAVEHDVLFGRAHIMINLDNNANNTEPLLISAKSKIKGNLQGFINIEPIWTTPQYYNSNDPTDKYFYNPQSWWVMGNKFHSDRLMTIVTRPVSDILKPAFNFAGMSLSQLAEPYVDNWLRTRQSVSDLINIFSTTVFYSDMSQILTSGDCNGENVSSFFDRARLFVNMRSNQGVMMADKERESIEQLNTPLSGLHELQSASQEHMCSVSKIPAVILTGISPGGLNASSEGEIKVFYDWINAQQESFWRSPIDTIIKCIQINLFGEVDETITFNFVPLYQMTEKEEAEILESHSRIDQIYIQNGVLDPTEIRERLASDHKSGYHGIDVDKEIVDTNQYDNEYEKESYIESG